MNEARDEIVLQEENIPESAPAQEKKSHKKKIFAIIGIVLVLVVVAVFALTHKSQFEKVKDAVLQMSGQIQSADNYFIVDTYPYDETPEMDPVLIKMLEDDKRDDTLKAIRYANNEFGFASYVYSDMLDTTAQMGRQSVENENYRISWTYHPNEGLEVTYERK